MLVSIHVKNLALIEEVELELQPGLNILTGETGAGKSILIGSMNLALGAKGDKDFIRKGAEYGLVELVFQSDKEAVTQKLEQLDLPMEEDNLITISRRIQPTRSVIRINGEIVTIKQLKELTSELIDIHGQHEHQSLLSKNQHMEILDFYGKEKLAKLQSEFIKFYKQWQTIQKQMNQDIIDDEAKKRELDFLAFEIEEIRQAKLEIGEDEQVEAQYNKLLHRKRINEGLVLAYRCSGSEDDQGALSQISRALKEVRNIVNYDEDLSEIEEQYVQIEDILNEVNRTILNYMDMDENEQEQFYVIEQRINEINRLKNKYGKSIEEILAYAQECENKVEKLQDLDAYMQGLDRQYQELGEKLENLGKKITTARKKYGKQLEEQLIEALTDLNFPQVKLEIRIEKKEITSTGYDEVEFLISTNPGEKVKSLGQVASGGELSRIMLGIKTVLNQHEDVETMIFDEIDTGISGKTAWKVSEKLGQLSKDKQVICITHLPQIAANADAHFYIEKVSDASSTETKIIRLNEQEMIEEVARMLGSDQVSQGALQNAIELKKLAGKN